jgi:predicted negative regulator of RcsB-dependent stress response
MPKPIKKRIQKKVTSEEQVVSAYERCRDYYERNKKFVHLAAAVLLVVFLGVTFLVYYQISISKQASALEYEGYKLYHGLYQTFDADDEETLNKALSTFQKALDKKSSSTRLLYIAYTQEKLGRTEEALQTLSRFVKKYSEERDLLPAAYYKLSMLQLKLGRKEDALTTLDTLYRLKGTPYLKDLALFEAAKTLEGMEKINEADQKYRLLTELYPESPYYTVALTKIEKKEELPTEVEEGKGMTEKEKAGTSSDKGDK